MKLVKIYNAAITQLRLHFLMVVYALRETNGEVLLVQLVHIKAKQLNKVDTKISGHYSSLKLHGFFLAWILLDDWVAGYCRVWRVCGCGGLSLMLVLDGYTVYWMIFLSYH